MLRKIYIILPLLLLIASCDEDGRVWMTIDPVQCLGNDWEQAWLEENGNNYELWAELSEADQLEIFKAYFESRGIAIHDILVTEPYEEVCQACTCPRGDRIHVLVDSDNLEQMMDWGFELE